MRLGQASRVAVVHFMLCRGLFFHPVALAYAPSLFGPLAQSVEQLAFNQLVAGSNPARPTIYQTTFGWFIYCAYSGSSRSSIALSSAK